MEDHAQSPATGGSPARGAARAPLPSVAGLADLVARMAQGQQEALAALYDETSPMLNGLLQRILERPEDAEEVLLDVYMKAWKNAGGYTEKRGSVQAWLVIMARNSAIDRMRQRRAEPRAAEFDDEKALAVEAPDDSPETQTAAAQRRRIVRSLLNELPAEQREAVLLAFFSGYTHAELADKLGEPLGTVKSRIRMGLIRLRGLMEEGGGLS
jgi:RNA polymerase sigma-70 factor (ECF subfamily)